MSETYLPRVSRFQNWLSKNQKKMKEKKQVETILQEFLEEAKREGTEFYICGNGILHCGKSITIDVQGISYSREKFEKPIIFCDTVKKLLKNAFESEIYKILTTGYVSKTTKEGKIYELSSVGWTEKTV